MIKQIIVVVLGSILLAVGYALWWLWNQIIMID